MYIYTLNNKFNKLKITEKIKNYVFQLLEEDFYVDNIESINTEDTLNSIGLDSMDIITLSYYLDDKFGISISEQEVQSWATIQDVFDTLQLYESIYS